MTSSVSEMTMRAAYVAPTLTVFGAVADLTASGTGASCEHQGNQPTCTRVNGGQPNRQRP